MITLEKEWERRIENINDDAIYHNYSNRTYQWEELKRYKNNHSIPIYLKSNLNYVQKSILIR